MNELIFGLFLLLLIGPYLLLFKKNINLSTKLVFISMIEMLILALLMTILYFTDNDSLSGNLFSFSIFVELIVIANILVILSIWIIKKVKKLSVNKNI